MKETLHAYRAGKACQRDIAAAAAEAGIGVRTLRRYIANGEIHPERVPCLGGFRFTFSDADIRRARDVAAWNMSELV